MKSGTTKILSLMLLVLTACSQKQTEETNAPPDRSTETATDSASAEDGPDAAAGSSGEEDSDGDGEADVITQDPEHVVVSRVCLLNNSNTKLSVKTSLDKRRWDTQSLESLEKNYFPVESGNILYVIVPNTTGAVNIKSLSRGHSYQFYQTSSKQWSIEEFDNDVAGRQ